MKESGTFGTVVPCDHLFRETGGGQAGTQAGGTRGLERGKRR
jgi:hypothetical protein